MRCYEFMAKTKKVLDVQPSTVVSQQRVAQVVNQIAANDQRRPPTPEEKVMARMQYANIKQRSDAVYAAQLKSQLARLQPQQPKLKVGGREKRND